MSISKMIELIPDSVKLDIIDFTSVKMKDGKKGTRILLDRILTTEEKEIMKQNKHFIGLECIANYKYAPEIKKSYFYIVY